MNAMRTFALSSALISVVSYFASLFDLEGIFYPGRQILLWEDR
jgi:hypothetical protein